MNGHIFYSAGRTDALTYAAAALRRKGCTVAQQPCSAVTHLLLDVPSFEADGSLRGGGKLQDVLRLLPEGIPVIGGNLNDSIPEGFTAIDLLKDPLYLAENANITAHCAVKLAMNTLPATLQGCPVLVVGWGRIGKCLASLLRRLGAVVSVAARKEVDRAMLLALGYDIESISESAYGLLRYRVIFNTVPAPILTQDDLGHCRPECIKIDLASVPGMAGEDVIHARGLPGTLAPETSGELIARTVLRLI